MVEKKKQIRGFHLKLLHENNPVRDYLSVERNNAKPPCIPSGMQPDNDIMQDAFLRNANGLVSVFLLPKETFLTECTPYGILRTVNKIKNNKK